MTTAGRLLHQQKCQGMEYQWTEIERLCGKTISQPRTFPQPVIVQHLANDWPAFRDNLWSFSQLNARFSHRYFAINGQATPMQMGSFLGHYGTLHDATVVNLSTSIHTFLSTMVPLTETNVHHLIESINHHLTPSPSSSVPWSIFDPSFEFDAPELLDDYSIPFLFTTVNHHHQQQHHQHDDLLSIIPTSHRPDHRWFIVGPKATGSCLHIDPLSTSAWNTLVVGCKHWIIMEPCTSSSLVRRIYSFIQHGGETVVIPREWSHAVLNLSFTTAITHNYVAPSEEDVQAFFLACRMEQKQCQNSGVVERWNDERVGGGGGGGGRLGAWKEKDMERWEKWMRDQLRGEGGWGGVEGSKE